VPPRQALSPQELALRANQALAQALLARSAAVRIELHGGSRAVVRHAKLRGLICRVAARAGADDAAIDISGPFALFRRTLLYGRALAELLPLLAWCNRFRLTADCTLRGQRLRIELAAGDPVFPAAEPRRHDSRLEERFARDFRRAAPLWDVVREPEPVEAAGRLLFPDFALVSRLDGRRWLLEIVGFWTPEYLAGKLEAYRAANLPNLILCVDQARACATEPLGFSGRVVPFRRCIDPQAVLAALG
jgi:predicted nuclease of restriction endonuclease-like RecB superfamily